jgi:tetratricopeptide (TPR) repeat protein/transcriptional regulator with XRE-family HTH domain
MAGVSEPGNGSDRPDPNTIHTQADLSLALTVLRKHAGLTVREIAGLVGIPFSTLGGYFSGGHLPRVRDRARITAIVRACGVADTRRLDAWSRALDRVYGLSVWPPEEHPRPTGPWPAGDSAIASIRPPVERLRREPQLRGRAELFQALASSTIEQKQPRVHVLHGPGGSGKSFLSLNLARWAMSRGIRTWWISAGETVTVSLGMQVLAVELGASPRQLELGSPADLAWRLLNGYRRPWLLVVDNADDPLTDFASPDAPISDATGWLRPIEGRHGTVVVTTRDGTTGTWGVAPSWLRLMPLGLLDFPTAAHVLREITGDAAGSHEEAVEVAARLGGLPLALRLAGLHIREARKVPCELAWPDLAVSFPEYARALDLGLHEEVLSPEVPRWRRARVDQTWEISLDVLESRGLSDARVLLRLLSCFAAAPIASGLLLDPAVLAKSPLFAHGQPAERPSGRRLWTLIQALAGLGLVDILHDSAEDEPLTDVVVLHPVLRAVYRRHAEVRRELGEYVSLLVALLDRAARGLYPSDPVSWPRWRGIAVHCHGPLDLLGELATDDVPVQEGILVPAMLAAQYLRASGRLVEAEAAYVALLERGRKILGGGHPDVLLVQQGLARVSYVMGRWEQAEEALRALLDIQRELFGPDHQDTLVTQHYLARVRHDQGDLDEAESLFRATLGARRRTFGSRDPATLSSMSNLANVWRSTGRLGEAERMLNIVLRNRRQLLGDDYPATLITRQYLAALRLDRGVRVADEPVFRALVADMRRVLGPVHPRTLAAEQLLGEALTQLGHGTQALTLLERILADRRHALGVDHPVTRRTAELLTRLRGGG